jgi:hypothetical protein
VLIYPTFSPRYSVNSVPESRFSLFFSLIAGNGQRRPVWRDCVHHQEVRASRHDFLRHRIARHFRSLPRQGPDHPGASNSWATKAAEALFHLVEPRRRRKTKEDMAKDHDPLNAWRRPFEEAVSKSPCLADCTTGYVETVRSAIAEDEPSAEASLS